MALGGCHSPRGEPEGRQREEGAEILEELPGPGHLHGHLALSHLVLHQDLSLHLGGGKTDDVAQIWSFPLSGERQSVN